MNDFMSDNGSYVGTCPWAYGGLYRPETQHANAFGEVWAGDPPHEAPGWYDLYDTDEAMNIVHRQQQDVAEFLSKGHWANLEETLYRKFVEASQRASRSNYLSRSLNSGSRNHTHLFTDSDTSQALSIIFTNPLNPNSRNFAETNLTNLTKQNQAIHTRPAMNQKIIQTHTSKKPSSSLGC